jgi:elongation factor P
MLLLTDLKVGIKFTLEGTPFVVTHSEHSKQGRGGAIMRTKLKNLITGTTVSRTFQGSEKFEEASLFDKSAIFLYHDEEKSFFMDSETYDQFEIENDSIGESLDYLTENSPVVILYYNNQPINIDLPIKMTFGVTDAPPGVKGNSAGTVTKIVTISTGKQVATPLFIKEGDEIVIDTRTGNYIERAN